MHEARLVLECAKPSIVAKSIMHDIKGDADVEIKTDKGSVVICIKSEKLSHLKAIVNSYISAVAMLNEVDEL